MKEFISVSEGNLYCESDGSGRAVVFIHGFSLDSRMWDNQFHIFSQRFQAIRYDVRGFGKSTLPTGHYDHGDDLARLLSTLGVNVAAVVGLSMGGAIAVNFVISHPEMVSAIVLADSSIGYMQPSREAVSFGRKIRLEEEREYLDSVKRLWLADDIFKPAFQNTNLRNAITAMVNDYSGYHWLHENPVARIDTAYMLEVRRIEAPAMVIVGEKDVSKHQRVADLLSRNIPGARKELIGGAGHMCNMEKPEAFNDLVLSFLT